MVEAPPLPPLSLYVHLPWCVRKCPYCDFNSHPLGRGASLPEDRYVEALLRDLDFELALRAETRPLLAIFFGGGTPSLFSPAAIGRILDGVAARLRLAADVEITLEANPGTADAGHFRGYRAAGVNRLSVGVQSFDNAQLSRLGRIHGADQARRALPLARAAGFDNVNLDLMYALPRQTCAQALDDLRAAIQLGAEHLSWYQLSVEPNTPFAAAPPTLPDEDAAWEMLRQGEALLAANGYTRYEVSAFAQDGRAARHNLNYWRFGDYLGIGAGAHSKRSQPVPGRAARIERCSRRREPRVYIDGAGTPAAVLERRPVPPAELAFEYALNALRLVEGFTLVDFERATGLASSALQALLLRAQARGLVEIGNQRVRASRRGFDLLNELLQMFLPDAPPAAA
ncbi:MAG: radical SAM family heme chaperone HemW [Gammaproteobacteria bacterium]|nr:radical SAM family heme chaperone HemW [Gammaproteobacteria bacterium]